jgi:D-alanyl-D-alanine carboxypeptidase/D-alanyl-D-alanine-endopeptidase (penicillin-binding protein 4)
VVTLPREVDDPTRPHERRVAELRQRLEEVLHDSPLSHTRTGIVTMQMSDGDVLFSHLADQRFNPASNTKILTTAAALDRLGGDYRYRTAVYGEPPDADGVVGDIMLRGSTDPSLTSADLAELARGLAERGITRVHGDILVDRRPIGLDVTGGDGLIFNRNAIALRIRPTEPKHAPAVSVEPAGAGIGVENHAVTVPGKKARLKIDAYRKDDHLVIEVRGRIGELRGTVVLAQRVADGALLCGHVLAATLADFGIAFDGRVRTGQLKDRVAPDSTRVDSIEGSEATASGDAALPRRNGSTQREVDL